MSEGRRERIKDKIRRAGIESLASFEVLEFLLYSFKPRSDTGNLGKELLKRFGSLDNVFNASERELLSVPGMPKDAALAFSQMLKIPSICADHSYKKGESNFSKPNIAGEYCYYQLFTLQNERLIALALDECYGLLGVRILSEGTHNATSIDTKDLRRFVIEQKAVNVIIAHNHPVGLLKPSEQDVLITKTVAETLNSINVKLKDHVIVNKSGWYSMRNEDENCF